MIIYVIRYHGLGEEQYPVKAFDYEPDAVRWIKDHPSNEIRSYDYTDVELHDEYQERQ